MSRQGYIGKENDIENGLGDNGVRKYDDGTGRFNSFDLMWEKYYGWSPYQYCFNNPVWSKDIDGKDIIVLLDKEGASGNGHMAALIGNDKNGWALYSKNGAKNGFIFGNSKYQAGEKKYGNLKDFLIDKNKLQIRYDLGFQIPTTTDQDEKMKKAAFYQAKSYYHLLSNSCADVPSDALNAVNKAAGTSVGVAKDKDGNEYPRKEGNSIPNDRYEDIKQGNPDGKELNLNELRKQKE
jgi:RHS repeat-associated protein